MYYRSLRDTELTKDEDIRPRRAHEFDAGYDLVCSRHTTVERGFKAQIPTNIAIDMPANVWGLLLARSSLFFRLGLVVHTGVIDPGYRGEIQLMAFNPSQKNIYLNEGDRVGQLILLPRLEVNFVKVEKENQMSAGDRGAAGFGSTGGFRTSAEMNPPGEGE